MVPRLREFMPHGQREQEAGFTQPKDLYLAEPCMFKETKPISQCLVSLDPKNWQDAAVWFAKSSLNTMISITS